MASSDEKKWNRPWSMEEMIENAENWSLAGDVALLNTLKAYSEKLFTKTVSLSDNVDNLLHSLDEVSLKLDLSQNEFQSLRDTQFVESRVYEDDETLDIKEESKPEEKPPEEEKEKMREAVYQGLRVMDKYYERIEVSISDSEDEESDKSYILRPKDLYADRPLPLVIGTEEWYKKWHVGLADSSSESESEKVSEVYSESDSEDDLPKDLMKGSESSSELDFSSQTSDNRPVANSTFNESAKKPNVFGSDEESDEQGSLPVKTPISNKNFAEQLAAKLGDVINEREDISSEINRKPIQPAQKKFAGDLFSDEPPPLDDDLEDTILPKSAQEGLFSGGQGLFDDNEDESFWGQQKESAVKPPIETGAVKQEPEQKASAGGKPLPKSSQVSKGLFDSDSDSTEEDIFTTKQTQVKKQFLQPFTTTAPLFDDEPPELDAPKKPTEDTIKKKPVGGVSIFGKPDLFSEEKVENILKSRQKDVADKVEAKPNEIAVKSDKTNQENTKPKHSLFDEEEQPQVETPPKPVSPKPKKISLFDDEEETKPVTSAQPKTTSLFDDDDDLFKDDLFTSKKLKSGLFDDEDIFSADVKKNETAPKADLFSDLAKTEDDLLHKKTEEKSLTKPKKNVSLFDSDNEEEEEEEELFGGKPTISNTLDASGSAVNREDEVSRVKDEVDKAVVETVEDFPRREVVGAEKLSTEKKAARGLFDESTEETDTKDLFKGGDLLETQEEGLFEKDGTLETEKLPTEKRTTRSLFEDSTEENDVDNFFTAQKKDQNLETGKLSTDKKATERLFEGSTEASNSNSDTENLFKQTSVVETQESGMFEKNQTLESAKNTMGNPPADVKTQQEVPELETIQPTPQASNSPEKVQPRNVTVNLFGSSPPPDDDDWDTKSIQSSDNDDQFSYRTDYNTAGSSLFDNEPPSLGPNDSSGIVRDQNTTRVDTDDSFNPYASSSRRLSSDVYNEQQSQDSFFVTKNKTESINIVAQLGSIPETGKSSNLEITPSGNLEDFESAEGDSSVFQDTTQNNQTATSALKKPILLFDDLDNSQETEDLFSSISKKDDLPALSNKRMSLFDNLGDVLNEKKQILDEIEKESPPVKAAESVKEIKEKMAAGQVAADEKETKKPPTGSPGKLKHNLKINVNALMPGSAPPKIRELTKSHSLELPKDQKDSSTNPSTPDGGFLTPTISNQRREVSSAGSESVTSFEDALNNVEVLHSVTKDRAKIPIKRRPSTRRGRQQVIQSAASDFTLGNEENSRLAAAEPSDVETNAKNVEPVAQNITIEPPKLSPHKFVPSSPQEAKTPLLEALPDTKPPKKGDIFGDLRNNDDEIFPSVQPLGKSVGVSVEEKPKSSIFGSEDSDDELFGGKQVKKTKIDDREKKSVKKKSLFNDSSSDEDLFSSTNNSNTKRKETAQKPVEKKVQKMLTTRKLENIETDEDPLSSLLK